MQQLHVGTIVTASISPLKPKNTMFEALNTMTKFSISSVVIADEKRRPIGIFTEHDALRMISTLTDVSVPLSEVMTTDPFTVSASMNIHNAYTLLQQKRFRHLVVVDENGLYVGMASEGDFIRNMGLDSVVTQKTVEDAMSESPLMIPPKTAIADAVKLMSEQQCDYAIITEGSQPKGILRERDIAHYFAKNKLILEESVDIVLHPKMHLVSRTIPLQQAAMMMEEHGVHQLIVVNDEGNVNGLLSRHNVLKTLHGTYIDFLIDIIDKKDADLATLHESQTLLTTKTALLDSVINTIPDLIWLKDANGIYLACNHMFERFFGAKESKILGKTDFDFVDKELATFFRENDCKAMKKGGSRNNEEYLVFADGSYEGLFDTIKTPMKDSDGNVIGVLGIARDISERKMREDALKQKDKDLKEAQNLAHVGSWKLDIKNDILEWSDECYRIFDMEIGSKLDYATFLDAIHPDDREIVDKAWSNALKGSVYDIDHRIIINEQIKWVRERANLQLDENNQLMAAVGTVQDVTSRKLYEEELEHLANFDSLTNLANRSFLLSHLQKSIHMATRNNRTIALLLFDLDHFKDINDSFGHSAGDELLKIVSQRFVERIRKGDLIARLGGDEFAVVLEHISRKEDAAQVAQEMMEVLSQPFKLSNKLEVHIGSSVGIVIAPKHSEDAGELLQYADTALYKAKSEGRSTYSYYTDELTNTARERISCENRLRRAIDNSEFELYYQPQVHMKTGRIIGAEALIRWNDPEMGMVSPVRFIPLAEETGLISDIGEWVIHEACRQGKTWSKSGHNLHVSVNVSAHQMYHQDLLKVVDNAIKESGFNAEKLTLELTESAMMQREEEVVAMLHALRAKGIRLAIDDFGTGYSSYSYLKRFPIDILKIDKTFIDDVPYESDDMAIVKAIIAMGTAMSYQIMAEGVEHKEQIDFLKEHQCTYYQGYYKSKPLPADEFEKLLQEYS